MLQINQFWTLKPTLGSSDLIAGLRYMCNVRAPRATNICSEDEKLQQSLPDVARKATLHRSLQRGSKFEHPFQTVPLLCAHQRRRLRLLERCEQ